MPSNYKDDCSLSHDEGSGRKADSQMIDLNLSESNNDLSDAWVPLSKMKVSSQVAPNRSAVFLADLGEPGRREATPPNPSDQTLFGLSDGSSLEAATRKAGEKRQCPIEYMEGERDGPVGLKDALEQNSFDEIVNEFASNRTLKDETRPSETDTKDANSIKSSDMPADLETSPTKAPIHPFDMRKKPPEGGQHLNLLQPPVTEIPEEGARISFPTSMIPMSMISKNSKSFEASAASNFGSPQ